jgi:hypothetical protein
MKTLRAVPPKQKAPEVIMITHHTARSAPLDVFYLVRQETSERFLARLHRKA